MFHLLVNPAAARGRALELARRAERLLSGRGLASAMHVSARPDYARELLDRLDGTARTVVAVGGDGTVNQLVNAIDGHELTIGVIPAGTGNDFARLLGLRSLEHAVDVLAGSRTRIIDSVDVTLDAADGGRITRRFINTMGCGFDAAVAARVADTPGRRGGGILPYLLAVLTELRHHRSVNARIDDGDAVHDLPLFLACLGNGTTSGGGFRLTPEADPRDGQLDLCIVRSLPRRRVLRVLPMAMRGRHLHEPEVLSGRTPVLRIDLEAPLPVHLDGEVICRNVLRIEARVRPASVRVLTAASSLP